MKRDFDVVVIGSGVAGAMAAYKLAQAKAKVLILEAGSRNPSRAQMVGAYALAPIKTPHSAYVQAEADSKTPSPDNATDYYEQAFNCPVSPHTRAMLTRQYTDLLQIYRDINWLDGAA